VDESNICNQDEKKKKKKGARKGFGGGKHLVGVETCGESGSPPKGWGDEVPFERGMSLEPYGKEERVKKK